MSVGVVDKQTGDRIPTAGMPAIDDALSAISTNPVQNAIITAALANKQDKTDNSLQTTDKTVVGAVNELKSGLTNKANVAIYHMGGGQTVNIEHTNIVAIMSDRGGLYTDGIANRGINDLVPSTQITVTHVDAAHVTVTNNSQYGTSILVLSDGDITMTPVQ